MRERAPEACVTMPYYEFAEGIFEIDEFDCASVFVVVGEQRALVIDAGLGIGDLKWLIEQRITDKPCTVALSHNHGDHMGGLPWFGRAFIHPLDMEQRDLRVAPTLEFRRSFAAMIAAREHRHYAYDPQAEIRPWPCEPELIPMEDGHRFELGGRTVTAYHCPGHTPGEMVFYDDLTRTLLAGDAMNEYYLLSAHIAPTLPERVRVAAEGLERVLALAPIERIYNFHHDYRGYGQPLAPDVPELLLAGLRAIRDGAAVPERMPDLLSDSGAVNESVRSGRVVISSLSGKLS